MLKGIAGCISPELLYHLHRMGHGDEILLADAFFPGDSVNELVIRADGIRIPELLDGILRLITLDSFVMSPVHMMAVPARDTPDPAVENSYREVIDRYYPECPVIRKLERSEFVERSKSVFAVVMSGETAKYGNILLRKGVTPSF